MSDQPEPKNEPDLAKSVIAGLGGTCRAAAFFEVRPGSVSEWLTKGIPKARLRHLRDVRPDLLNPPIVCAGDSAQPASETDLRGG